MNQKPIQENKKEIPRLIDDILNALGTTDNMMKNLHNKLSPILQTAVEEAKKSLLEKPEHLTDLGSTLFDIKTKIIQTKENIEYLINRCEI